MGCIHWLEGCDDPLAAGVGGKGASLVRLCKAGFPVPPGFAVGVEGYWQWVVHNELQDAIDAVLSVPDLRLPKVAREAAAPLKERLGAAELPPHLKEAATAAYGELRDRRGDGLVVAVRSSALSEDAAGASSAGLYETYLNIRDEATMLDGIERCYQSLWTHRAVQYRAFKNIDSRREAMGVVVMEMVPAEVSGVAFTVNPLSGAAEEIVINASWGLGEAVVSGRVTPDSFVVRKADLAVVGRDVYEKELMIQPDPSGCSGTVALAVPPERVQAPALEDEGVRRLAQLCLEIERHYGCPQDVEWALSGRELYVLQSRPVTALR